MTAGLVFIVAGSAITWGAIRGDGLAGVIRAIASILTGGTGDPVVVIGKGGPLTGPADKVPVSSGGGGGGGW